MKPLLLLAAVFLTTPPLPNPDPEVFPTAEEAAQAFIEASSKQDTQALAQILGPDADTLINSGDSVQDAARRDRLVGRAKEAMHVEPNPHRPASYLISVGKDDWPVPLPIVKVTGGYRFDPNEAKEEILARRVGHNELRTIAALRELVDAEREYAYLDVGHNGLHEYAGQILSDPGKKNGLFWEASGGEGESPLAALVHRAEAEGYGPPAAGQPPTYHGYTFRLLRGQGSDAHGGARDYVVRGRWIGFALLAFPVEYQVSGVKTFVAGHKGVVWEKDLGARTAALASAMLLYNPDKTWTRAPIEAPEPSRP